MKKTLKTSSALLVSALFLTGCANFPTALMHGGNPITQPFSYKKAQAISADETTFKGALVKEYKMLATKEGDIWSDWFDSDFFAKKAIDTSMSENGVLPEDPAMWRFKTAELAQFEPARSELVSVLDQTRATFPVLSARAQSRFDCWVEEEEEGWQDDLIAGCKEEFKAAMAELTSANDAGIDLAKLYTIFFDFDSSEITAVGQQVLQALVQDWGSKEAALSLVGHADTSGNKAYNQALSERRAKAVSGFIENLGVSTSRVSASGKGETSLAVSTEDGVREARNRRVVIEVQE